MFETILQFGAGNFLRGFVDLFVAELNRGVGTGVGKVVVVQSMGRAQAELLNACGGRYHVVIQGMAEGSMVDEVVAVDSISRALHAGSQWGEVLAVARGEALRWIVSNTTEAGFALDDRDGVRPAEGGAPHSFPAKLLEILLTRYEAGLPGVGVVPCELIERNGERLRELVVEQAGRWGVEAGAVAWLRESVCWVESLVDRIVPGPPVAHALKGSDPLLLSAEPYVFWGVQGVEAFWEHPVIKVTGDLTPYYLRKVRILNGAHSALVAYARPRGFRTVRECVEDAEVGAWLRAVLEEEILPVIAERVVDAKGFVRATLERFRNPFFEHRLESIALNHEAKVRTRLLPTVREYRERFGKSPGLLSAVLGV